MPTGVCVYTICVYTICVYTICVYTICVYTISMDLPFAQARWQEAEGVTHQALSAHRSEQFGQEYGVLINEWRLLQRAVFVLDGNGRIMYAEYVADQMREPNYEAALQAVRAAIGNSG